MPSIAATEAQLRADNCPVLFLDTCVIVDIIRATLRCMGTNFVQSAVELHGLLESAPAGCALVVASVVPTEWGNHAPKTRDEVRGHLAKIQDQAQHFHAACGALGVGLAYGLPAYPAANLHDRLFDLSREILDLAVVLDTDGGCATRAIGRVVAKLAHVRQPRTTVVNPACGFMFQIVGVRRSWRLREIGRTITNAVIASILRIRPKEGVC